MSKKSSLVFIMLVLALAIWVSLRLISERRDSFQKERMKYQGAEEGEVKLDAEGDDPGMKREEVSQGEIKIHYLGHACFLVEAGDLCILMDPYSPQVGYSELEVETDIVTLSHEHMDHNYASAAVGAKVIRGLTPDALGWEDISISLGEVTISGLPSYHDDAAGKLRGRNMIFILDLEGLRLVHLGDLGHLLNENQVEKLVPVDILLIPVGGHYTIDAEGAKQVIEQLSPRIVIPMHYRTEVTRNWPIAGIKPFLEGEDKIREIGKKAAVVSKGNLPGERVIWLMEPVSWER